MGLLDRFSAIGGSAFGRKKKPSAKSSADKKETKKELKLKKVKEEKKAKPEYSSLKPKDEAIAKVTPGIKEKAVKTTRKSKADTKNAYKVLIKPLITEKASALAILNKYCFEVAKDTNKIEVKKAIKSLYGMEPIDVNIINMRGKRVRYGRVTGKKKNWKKAIVSLKQGDKIELYEGV